MPSQAIWGQLLTARKQLSSIVKRARTKQWRRDIAEATTDPKGIWRLSKWAQYRSHCKPADAKMPAFGRLEGESPTAFSHVEKTTLLKERFFPNPFTDLADIGDRTFVDEFNLERFTIN